MYVKYLGIIHSDFSFKKSLKPQKFIIFLHLLKVFPKIFFYYKEDISFLT